MSNLAEHAAAGGQLKKLLRGMEFTNQRDQFTVYSLNIIRELSNIAGTGRRKLGKYYNLMRKILKEIWKKKYFLF